MSLAPDFPEEIVILPALSEKLCHNSTGNIPHLHLHWDHQGPFKAAGSGHKVTHKARLSSYIVNTVLY